MHFDMRPDKVGWTVYDVDTGRPVSIEDVVLVELEMEDADAVVVLLNKRFMQATPNDWLRPPDPRATGARH